jgi:hypothetical protein
MCGDQRGVAPAGKIDGREPFDLRFLGQHLHLGQRTRQGSSGRLCTPGWFACSSEIGFRGRCITIANLSCGEAAAAAFTRHRTAIADLRRDWQDMCANLGTHNLRGRYIVGDSCGSRAHS